MDVQRSTPLDTHRCSNREKVTALSVMGFADTGLGFAHKHRTFSKVWRLSGKARKPEPDDAETDQRN
jgi:hypothetical protein